MAEADKILKNIEDTLKQKTKNPKMLKELSEQFYTLIPHNFGFAKMSNFIIRDQATLKDKAELVTELIGIQQAVTGVQTRSGAKNKKVETTKIEVEENPYDTAYSNLNCDIKPLDVKSQEYQMLSEYVQNSNNGYKLQILEIYKLNRDGEDKKFNPDKIGNRKLLFHGSSFSNFVGILTNGMRIAPPEAPCSGYNFGKGVYTADMAGKSANYCRTYQSGGVGLFVMCEVALGK